MLTTGLKIKASGKKRTLFVKRTLVNADEFIAWAKEQGFPTVQLPDDLHVTVAYSKTPVVWPPTADPKNLRIKTKTARSVESLGDNGAVVLKFESSHLKKQWQDYLDYGCSYDYESYTPHVTITWQAPEDLDLSKVTPFDGDLVFGPEEFEEIDSDWREDHTEKLAGLLFTQRAKLQAKSKKDEGTKMPKTAKSFNEVLAASREATPKRATSFKELIDKVGARHTRKEYEKIQQVHDAAVELGAVCSHEEKSEKKSRDLSVKVSKADDELGIVFGWAIISSIDGEPYYDTQDDHIPEDAMLKAAAEFMQTRRQMKVMHSGNQKGTVVFAFPVTDDIAKALEIESPKTGLMIGVKPDDKRIIARFKSGEYTGFSIGGDRLEDEEVEDDDSDEA